MSNEMQASNGSLHESIDIPVPDTSDTEPTIPTKKSSRKGKAKANGTPEAVVTNDMLDNKLLLRVLSEVKDGNFSVRLPVDKVGIEGKICDTLNEIIHYNEILVQELAEARNIIGKQGKLNHRVELPKAARGAWKQAVDSTNSLISDLVHPTIEIAHVISSVAKGNLSEEMPLKIGDHVLQGEF